MKRETAHVCLFPRLPLLVSLLLIAAAPPSNAETPQADPNSASCRAFVQKFYDWYLKRSSTNSDPGPLTAALKLKTSPFTPALHQQLVWEEAVSASHSDEVEGLDFDPVLNAQDNPLHIVVGKVRLQNGKYLVEVFEDFGDKKKSDPVVMPELAQKSGEWVFTNFYYPPYKSPKGSNLMSMLKEINAKYPPHKAK